MRPYKAVGTLVDMSYHPGNDNFAFKLVITGKFNGLLSVLAAYFYKAPQAVISLVFPIPIPMPMLSLNRFCTVNTEAACITEKEDHETP